ncbi:MAG: hypothetical protein JWN67_418 [Actinomycetia bacterium]|nr:hypothetical protein [Actinomycetes bacterium]
MTWAKLDDGFVDHPKVDPLSDGAFRLHVAGIVMCSRLLTDGFVAHDRATRLVPRFKKSQLGELEAAGLWVRVEGGWLIHDYLDFNPGAEQVKADRAKAAERQRRWKASRRGDGVTNAVSDGVTNAAPTRPGPKGLGSGGTSPRAVEPPAPPSAAGWAATDDDDQPEQPDVVRNLDGVARARAQLRDEGAA